MSTDDEDELKLYSALDRNQKRQLMVSLSSSSDESGEDDDTYLSMETSGRKRRKRSSLDKALKKSQSIAKEGTSCQEEVTPPFSCSRCDGTVSFLLGHVHTIDISDEEDELYTPSEREAERLRKLQLEREIKDKLENDKLLNQTRAILNKVSTTQRQKRDVVCLDSDSSDESDTVVPIEPIASDKGARILLHIRSNGGAVDEVAIHKKEPFEQLYVKFCELHGLPRSAVKMSLDGEALSLQATPASEDLDSGDLIDAKVDFSKQMESKKKTYVRLRLVMFGKRSEVFKIDSAATVEKLHASYCRRHSIANPNDVILSLQDRKLLLSERLDFYGLMDDDEILVKHVSKSISSALDD
ncbi:hypothetical protein PsorP6_005363 [Peronosclerospora sorghi]|uniref:Uncharacterized protein n=1 Tax=Peronosclerospora sorghi TaxID=230839 RepID=A0ACC0W5Y1_9STRA|nr:hypothetical protein PsorP6_005363 [Peronosclerospora sorghi]